jgi:hypothetical protein
VSTDETTVFEDQTSQAPRVWPFWFYVAGILGGILGVLAGGWLFGLVSRVSRS